MAKAFHPRCVKSGNAMGGLVVRTRTCKPCYRENAAKTVFLAFLIVLATVGDVPAFGPGPPPGSPQLQCMLTKKSSLVEGRLGYFWGFGELRLRDGDNGNIAPGRRNVDLHSPILELAGEHFFTRDLAARGQAWVNAPTTHRNEFLFNAARAWDTRAQYVGIDLAAVYHFGLGRMPYTGGIIAGYRFNYFDLRGNRVTDTSDTFNEETQVHIPYAGVYYAHSELLGTVTRLDILASPLTLAQVDVRRHNSTEFTEIDGHSVTGIWFESFFQIALPVTESALVGMSARYNCLELHGGATVDSTAEVGSPSTRFSMDYRFHLFTLGITATYTF